MNSKGGNSCAFTMCSNIAGRTKNISFFRFLKNIERSKLWIEACGRQDLMKKTSEELHKNYRACALHFSQKMFLNDLQNRLQSNAVPIREHNIQERQEDTTPCNITPNQCNYQEQLELPLESDILLLDHLEANTSNYVPNIEERESKETQTDSTLSRNSPKKKLIKCKKRIALLQNKIYRLQKKINTNKINTKNKIETQECMEQYLNSTDHFLPAPLAEFVKTQVRLHQQKKKELH